MSKNKKIVLIVTVIILVALIITGLAIYYFSNTQENKQDKQDEILITRGK